MKILAFAASNSRNSINRKLVEYVTAQAGDILPDANFTLLDLNEYEMPIYSIDREQADGIHPLAQSFFDQIGAADAVIVSFAEHNGTTSAAWKNIFDWMSRIDRNLWQSKPVLFFAASPGGRAGQGALESQEKIAPFFGAELKAVTGIGNWGTAWNDEAKALTDPADVERVRAAIAKLG